MAAVDDFEAINKRYREICGTPVFETKKEAPKLTPFQASHCKRDCGISVHGIIRQCDHSCYAGDWGC